MTIGVHSIGDNELAANRLITLYPYSIAIHFVLESALNIQGKNHWNSCIYILYLYSHNWYNLLPSVVCMQTGEFDINCNPLITFCVLFLTDKQTNTTRNITSFANNYPSVDHPCVDHLYVDYTDVDSHCTDHITLITLVLTCPCLPSMCWSHLEQLHLNTSTVEPVLTTTCV